jgi:hypothetical protein
MAVSYTFSCENAPRKAFVIGLYEALMRGEEFEVEKHSLYNSYYRISPCIGVKELFLDSVITHGATVAVEGRGVGSDGSTFVFGDFFVFSSAGSSKVRNWSEK